MFSGGVERDRGMKWVNLKQLKEIGHEYFLVIIRPFTKKREREFVLSACVLLWKLDLTVLFITFLISFLWIVSKFRF